MSVTTTLLLIAGAGALWMVPSSASAGKTPEAPNKEWSTVEFSIKPRDEVAHPWTMHLDATGSGAYTEAGQTDQPITISKATLERVAQGERRAKSGRCQTHQKNIANTGEKTIRFISGDRTDACTFNFSDDSALMDATGAFLAIAETIQAGERLQHEQRFDRLSLDAEIDTLLTGIKNGSAIELGNIAPVLQSLVEDDHVIDRVRRKAARLLQDSGSSASPSGADRSSR